MRPFGSHKKKKTNSYLDDGEDSENSDDDQNEVEHPDEQILGLNKEGSKDEDEENNYDESGEDRTLACELINDDNMELETTDVNGFSDEDDDDSYTSESCKKTLSKV
ncbi:hypothetical protein PTTG_06750 [Puccinia triticina 1-1 BBBD Race 1]|uniref:Uncharacterized protein n=1 Tax=Puccinia triticina (isolate 1-1 / race 1 (BBBD)) TaxID=630390 RepID=A0A0C4F0Y0_PUCT1|nr:hypothetical protein PTTG_06750 [Puccinia triticina 1-1 BBBD Race 1]